ncbi:hypothetical protein [Arthrobacter sp. NPDC056727]|uniref:hypothetical protein n=1 Tax=Arthrobacter sp. NPDC056727 TaxID=3345927 RepID=UPI00366EB6D5
MRGHDGAFAMGGMACCHPQPPQYRRSPRRPLRRSVPTRFARQDGFDGSWIAYADLVPVCQEVFDSVLNSVLGDKPNQLDKQRPEVSVTAGRLLDIASAEGQVTEAGLRLNLYVAVAYTAVWISGNGAVAIHNLMEDAATAEISRSQVWQQIRNEVVLADTGQMVTRELVTRILAEETEKLRSEVGEEAFARYYQPANHTDFLTTPAYKLVGRGFEGISGSSPPAATGRPRKRLPTGWHMPSVQMIMIIIPNRLTCDLGHI